MITKFKLFENKQEPQIGDYVICDIEVAIDIKDINYVMEQKYKNFLRNNIGKYVKNVPDARFSYCIAYDYIPNEFKFFIRKYDDFPNVQIIGVERSEILVFSKNKEDLEVKLNANKYNL